MPYRAPIGRRALARLRDHSLRLRDHPGPVGGWQSVCWGGTPYFRLFNVIWYLPSPYYRLFNVLWNLPSPYYRLINVLWLPFLKIKKFRVPSLTKSLGYLPWQKFRVHSMKTQSLGYNPFHVFWHKWNSNSSWGAV